MRLVLFTLSKANQIWVTYERKNRIQVTCNCSVNVAKMSCWPIRLLGRNYLLYNPFFHSPSFPLGSTGPTRGQCCQIGWFTAQLGYLCWRQAGKKYIGQVNKILAAFVHIWRVVNFVKTELWTAGAHQERRRSKLNRTENRKAPNPSPANGEEHNPPPANSEKPPHTHTQGCLATSRFELVFSGLGGF